MVLRIGVARGARGLPNSNASHVKYATKKAILFSVSFSCLVFTLTADRKDLLLFIYLFIFGFHLIFGQIQLFSPWRPFFAIFLFWFSRFGWPLSPILSWSPTKFRSPLPQSKILNRTVKIFFLSSLMWFMVCPPPPPPPNQKILLRLWSYRYNLCCILDFE